MKLSERQVRIVNAFLRECATDEDGGSEAVRTQTVTRIRRELRDELARRNDATLRDDELIRVLNRIQYPDRAAMADAAVRSRPPATTASTPSADPAVPRPAPVKQQPSASPPVQPVARELPTQPAKPSRLPSGPLASSQRVWLGVCIALAEQVQQSLNRVRLVFVVAGVLTGPVAFCAYLCAYAALYSGKLGAGAPRIDYRRLVRVVAEPVVALTVMAVFVSVGRLAIDTVFMMVLGYAPELGSWGGITSSSRSMLFGALSVTIPFAALSGLPVAPPWDVNMPRFVRIVLACVAAIFALGLASYLAGALIDGAQNWTN